MHQASKKLVVTRAAEITMASGSGPSAPGMAVTIDGLEVFWPYTSMYKEQYLYMQELIKGAGGGAGGATGVGGVYCRCCRCDATGARGGGHP